MNIARVDRAFKNIYDSFKQPKTLDEIKNLGIIDECISEWKELKAERSRIVHCKDCKYWDRDLKCVQDLGDHVGVCMQAKWFCGEEGFCLYGTKKEV